MRRKTALIPIETKCLSCGKQVTETLGRLKQKLEPVCPACGGKLDMEPIRQFALKVVKDLKVALEADMEIHNPEKK
jgi:DNA-directed RNA polymerase subunit RPC12/RpoP